LGKGGRGRGPGPPSPNPIPQPHKGRLGESVNLMMKIMHYKCNNCGISFNYESKTHNLFNNCPYCGAMYKKTIEYIKHYFRLIQLEKELEEAYRLILKNELNAAVREALIRFEAYVKKKSGLTDLIGLELMSNAFSFKYDQKSNIIIEYPKIQINDLSNITKRNEQDGIKFMAMGLMRGIRNIYIHSEPAGKLYYSLQIITIIDLMLKQIIGWKITR
jgi:uncharacterized protein (TIGR02391 family)